MSLRKIISILGIALASFGLYVGISSINASGLNRIGMIFIPPSIVALILLILDLRTTSHIIKQEASSANSNVVNPGTSSTKNRAIKKELTPETINRKLTTSYISTFIKIGALIFAVYNLMPEIKDELEGRPSNFGFYSFLTISLIVITIPSIINIVKLRKLKDNNKKK